MDWLKKIMKKLFKKDIIKTIDVSNNKIEKSNNIDSANNDFNVELWKSANIEANDGNGYKIKPSIKLKDRR